MSRLRYLIGRLQYLIGRWRLLHGFCPMCAGDAPAVDTCPFCESYRGAFLEPEHRALLLQWRARWDDLFTTSRAA